MKNIFLILITFISVASCKAQTAPLYNADYSLPEGTYFKDLENNLNKFEGTWLWQNGNNSLTMILEKKEHIPFDEYYNDMIIGEYQYIENGTETINYLPRLEDNTIIGHQHYLSGSGILYKYYPPQCDECEETERRVLLHLNDPERPHVRMRIALRYILENNGLEKLEGLIHGGGTVVQEYEGQPVHIRVPSGNYVFIKQ
jgi:hypothetical protein